MANRYSVSVMRKKSVWEEAFFFVTADSAKEAEKVALEEAKESPDDLEWQLEDEDDVEFNFYGASVLEMTEENYRG